MTNEFTMPPGNTYLAGPPRQVPGFAGLHRMAMLLLAERVPADGRLLVLGAGGGLEIKAFAEAQPGWRFDGVDPSAEMLALAAQTIKPWRDRVQLHHGDIDSAPCEQFDGATCLLTFHFIPHEQRLATLRKLHQRLKPAAPLIVAHLSLPAPEQARSRWLDRHLAFSATEEDNRKQAKHAMQTRLSILSPEEDENLLREAGFSDVSLFYAGFSFRGWVAWAA